MQLTDGVHGIPITAQLGDRELTLNPVAVETPQGLLLVDVGLPGGLPDLADSLESAGLALSETWAVVLTHKDLDHVGCLAAVVDRTDATVIAHEADAPVIEGETAPENGDPDHTPTTVDIRLVGGETFATAAGPLRAVHTPGHSPGHTSLYFPGENLLLPADALNVVDGELVGPREDVTPDLGTAWQSVGILGELEIDHTHCFHGGNVEAGTDRIETLLAER